MRRKNLSLDILPQPDEQTCGATCLHAVYRYWGDEADLSEVVSEVQHLETGGTLASLLGLHALKRGYHAILYVYNLQIFDPTWFNTEGADLEEKLLRQATFKGDEKLRIATQAYVEFLDLGGEIRFAELNGRLLRRWLDQSTPVLTGLNATYLYRTAREYGPKADYDDIRGEASGHFVVLSGYNREKREVLVADPLKPNPIKGNEQYYRVPMDRLLSSILLGVMTYDANLLMIEPPEDG